MSSTDTNRFEKWYSQLKGAIVGPDETEAAEQKGDKKDRCVEQVMAQGHDEQSAHAICEASLKADLDDTGRDVLLDAAASTKSEDQPIVEAFDQVATKADVDLPTVCRKCDGGANRTRIVGAFLCPTCAEKSDADAWADFDAEESEYELAGEPGENQKADDPDEGGREVRFGNVGGDPFGDEDILEEFIDALEDAGAEVYLGDEPAADASGIHDRPVVARGISVEAAEEVWVEFEDEAVALSGPSDPDEKAEEFAMQVFRVVAAEDDDTEYDGDLLGLGVDFPESGVYVDWRLEAFPDPLDEGHVSDYGSIEDLEKATGNQVKEIQTYSAPTGADQKAEAEREVRVEGGVSAAPEGITLKCDHKGLYYTVE